MHGCVVHVNDFFGLTPKYIPHINSEDKALKRDGLLIQTQETMTARYLRRGSGKTTEGEQKSGTTASDLEIILIPLGFLVMCLLLYCWRKKYNASFERALQASIQLRRTNENKEKLNQLKDKLIKKVCNIWMFVLCNEKAYL